MKITIRFFSGTGNSEFIANTFKKNLINKERDIDCTSIENQNGSVGETDLLIIGGPIYAGNIPEKMIRWLLRNIPKTEKKTEAIIYTTSAGLENAYGVQSMRKKLEKKGYKVISMPTYIMARSFYFGKYKPTPNDEIIKTITNAESDVIKLINNLDLEKQKQLPLFTKKILGIDLMAELFSVMARGMGKKYSSTNECINCDLCIRECPQKNIFKQNEKVNFGKNCMMCTRCIHNCPVRAIEYEGSKYIQYKGPNSFMKKIQL